LHVLPAVPIPTQDSVAFSKTTADSGVRSHPVTDTPWHMQGTWSRGSVPLTFGSRPTGASPPRPGNQDRRADRPDCGSPPKTNPFWDELIPAEQARIVGLLWAAVRQPRRTLPNGRCATARHSFACLQWQRWQIRMRIWPPRRMCRYDPTSGSLAPPKALATSAEVIGC